ncbi:hypothetical protein OBBRIDRAFT_809339 [Obba rivulosa]|uniref:Uncharacterized protein n=1 Tax=Obba rivulosa TaxID=1052685 RepID=A0A8E2DUA7_9APHY|nr:hypothetical protein OBBRIDRAFT_809339 [Obba rivulosa]
MQTVPPAGSPSIKLPDASAPTVPEEELSEAQLRELYDEEEIERFLRLFSAYVREVKVAPSSQATEQSGEEMSVLETETYEDEDVDDPAGSTEGPEDTSRPPPSPDTQRTQLLTEWLAERYLLPLLPPPRQPSYNFTMHRLQLTLQRLYLSTVPILSPFVAGLVRLATWRDRRTSFTYCAMYWMLWHYNFLLPSVFLVVLYNLSRRKLFPYPTLAELREHRRELDRAEGFSSALAGILVSSSHVEIRDVWRVFRNIKHARKLKEAANLRNAHKDIGIDTQVDSRPQTDVFEKQEKAMENSNMKRTALFYLSELADLLERMRNIFLWRQPAASFKYGLLVLALFLLSMLPVQYLSKLAGFICGVCLWHIVPILAAIPASQRKRFPIPFREVPTDAEYAMELISQRVARGLDVKPRIRRRAKRPETSTEDMADGFGVPHHENGELESLISASAPVDWKKVGERVADAKDQIDNVKTLLRDGGWKRKNTWAALNPLAPRIALPSGALEPRVQAHTFPAQHGKTPGLITLTSSSMIFTPVYSTNAKSTIPIADITGLKKLGLVKGVSVRWMDSNDNSQAQEREANFAWVGGRDELFARLVGIGGHQWSTS